MIFYILITKLFNIHHLLHHRSKRYETTSCCTHWGFSKGTKNMMGGGGTFRTFQGDEQPNNRFLLEKSYEVQSYHIFRGKKNAKISRIRKQVPTCSNTLARNPNSFQIWLRLLSPTHLVHKTAKKKPWFQEVGSLCILYF